MTKTCGLGNLECHFAQSSIVPHRVDIALILSRLCHNPSQPAEEEAGRRVLRMAQDDRAVAQGSAPWHLQGGLGLHLASAAYNLVRMRNLAIQTG